MKCYSYSIAELPHRTLSTSLLVINKRKMSTDITPSKRYLFIRETAALTQSCCYRLDGKLGKRQLPCPTIVLHEGVLPLPLMTWGSKCSSTSPRTKYCRHLCHFARMSSGLKCNKLHSLGSHLKPTVTEQTMHHFLMAEALAPDTLSLLGGASTDF